MFWQIVSKYYSIIVRLNYKKKKLLLYTNVFWEILQINVQLSWTPIRMKGEIYPVTTRGRKHECKDGLASSIMLRQAHVSTRTAYYSSGRSRFLPRYISSSIYSCVHDNFLLIFYLLTDVVHFYIIILIIS